MILILFVESWRQDTRKEKKEAPLSGRLSYAVRNRSRTEHSANKLRLPTAALSRLWENIRRHKNFAKYYESSTTFFARPNFWSDFHACREVIVRRSASNEIFGTEIFYRAVSVADVSGFTCGLFLAPDAKQDMYSKGFTFSSRFETERCGLFSVSLIFVQKQISFAELDSPFSVHVSRAPFPLKGKCRRSPD